MNKGLKDRILELRTQGYSYNKIAEELSCNKGTVSYHLGMGVKEKSQDRRKKNRTNTVISKKVNAFKKGQDRAGKVEELEENFCTKQVLQLLLNSPKCYLSGRDINIADTSSWHLDHKIPLSRGGTSELSNLGIATREANQAKSDMLLSELIELCKDILITNSYSVTRGVSLVIEQ